jgi:hypothetical protein
LAPTTPEVPQAPCSFDKMFRLTRKDIAHALSHASHDEAHMFAGFLLERGLDLLGRLAGFDSRQAKLIIPESPADELFEAIAGHARFNKAQFHDVVNMLVQHLHDAAPTRWN